VQVCKELVSEPNKNIVVTIEIFAAVALVVALILWTEGPHAPRNQSSLVLWLLWHFHTRVWPLDCSTEALATAFVLLLLIDDILIVIWVPEAVFIPVIIVHGCNSHPCTPL
jgi:integral membrane sensor domain MASE1